MTKTIKFHDLTEVNIEIDDGITYGDLTVKFDGENKVGIYVSPPNNTILPNKISATEIKVDSAQDDVGDKSQAWNQSGPMNPIKERNYY